MRIYLATITRSRCRTIRSNSCGDGSSRKILDPATQIRKEVAFPLALSKDKRYLEAKVDSRTLPAPMAAKIRFKPDGPEGRFDFTFTEFSKDPIASPAPAKTVAAKPASNRRLPIPGSIEQMVAQLSTTNRQIKSLIDGGAFADIWVSAFQAKDLALAVGAQRAQLPAEKRRILEPAITRLLRAAWLLDAVGDLGNRDQITRAYADFRSAVSEIESLLQPAR